MRQNLRVDGERGWVISTVGMCTKAAMQCTLVCWWESVVDYILLLFYSGCNCCTCTDMLRDNPVDWSIFVSANLTTERSKNFHLSNGGGWGEAYFCPLCNLQCFLNPRQQYWQDVLFQIWFRSFFSCRKYLQSLKLEPLWQFRSGLCHRPSRLPSLVEICLCSTLTMCFSHDEPSSQGLLVVSCQGDEAATALVSF